MPRANRYFLPGHVWHITHRCHKKEFLLKFSRDRTNWLRWLFEAKKRYGLCVLNYIVTSNHVHLLVSDTKEGIIPQSMQLIAGRTAQEFNQRKQRKGAYWEDRYHATAIEDDEHLFRCLVYIDLNMVRAGVVSHPGEWKHSGYQAIQKPPKRYSIIDLARLMELCGFTDQVKFQTEYRSWVMTEITKETMDREAMWTESLAVGSQSYVKEVHDLLGVRAKDRECVEKGESYQLKEPTLAYAVDFSPKMNVLSE
jgi:REP element-mobilizing transposase RayT